MAYGGQRWFIVGCYLALDDAATTNRVVTDIIQPPCGAALLVTRDFIADLANMEGSNCGEEIAAAILTAGMEDMYVYLLMR